MIKLLPEISQSYQTPSRTKILHALITKTHLSRDPFYATKLVRFYAMNDDIVSARNLFEKTPQRTVFLWNAIIRAYAQAQKFDDAISLFIRMAKTNTKPDNFTYACLIRACYENSDLDGLRVLHGGVTVYGLGSDFISCSALVTAYSKLGLVDEASKVFYGTFELDLVLWNSMISGHGCCGFWDKGLELFNKMRSLGKQPDGFTLVGLISGLICPSLLPIGQGIHGFCLKSGIESNSHVGSALVSLYSRFKCMSSAHNVLSSLCQPDLVTWSALITGYSQSGDYLQALLLFRSLNMEGKKADHILISSVLTAAAQITNVRPGIEIHGSVFRHGLQSNIMVSSALIDMYSKCGFLGLGIRVFEAMPEKNVVSYNSVISGLGLHGLASQAFKMWEDLISKGLKPDESTFSALLCACCHAGLVNDGWELFKRMKDEFCIQVRNEHYVLMVKLLGMAGKLEEAYDLVLSLPKPVDSGIWGALLSCCDVHGNSELGEIVAQHIFDNEPKKGAYRVMLSNIYAGEGRWNDVKQLRDDITDGGQRKVPGVSWIDGYGY
ncbi:hypothetical protein HS088_TW08G00326 [Tripterygium wilfordii]|uniref:Pentatricopeptide repeat-containing protein n=1 Tax=Tripterygium wilfordii TaxID=458696 RepID=A0A7J7DBU5_TRIWF|nr:putative pentatricopeptide repeat-containing protein At1g64310 [Tripterygium wilfordii]XP_038708731.1 putative pentatricopeptide repeat-containing protein At1g64310 [Tripterygium wilfordii]XP_038708732.1 putative pentatricopeptide repeat-containing protein At1g64310 [Tripterygium wilfordii]KAF5743739.1 hypothetical protein HS088_TW08G00326 [Tripterygium wilfordii]